MKTPLRTSKGVARHLLEACGLDFEPGCLDFHRTQRRVKTASVGQVRQPIYSRSVGRWKNYESELPDLFRAPPGGTESDAIRPTAQPSVSMWNPDQSAELLDGQTADPILCGNRIPAALRRARKLSKATRCNSDVCAIAPPATFGDSPALPGRIEKLEGRLCFRSRQPRLLRTWLAITASTIELAPFVKDSDPVATLTYDLVSATTSDGGQVSVDAATGVVSYTPALNSVSPDSFQYFATDSDGDTSAMTTVTLNLSSVAANPVVVSEVEGQSTINLTILNLPGAVQDSSSKPSYTFSDAQVANGGRRHSQLDRHENGTFTYTPPSSTFTGDVIISYQITDGTGPKARPSGSISARSLPTPSTWAFSRARMRPFPSTNVPSLVNRIHDVERKPIVYASQLDSSRQVMAQSLIWIPASGSFTYTRPTRRSPVLVSVQYSVSDGTNSTTGEVSIVVAPLVTQPVTVTELDHQNSVSLTILNLAGAVQDISGNPSYTFSNLRVLDGGGSVPATGFDDSSVGAFTYNLPAAPTPHPVHIGYTRSATARTPPTASVTIQLVGIEASSANFAVLENTPSTLPALERPNS